MIHASCPICSELFETDSILCACPCGHTFHEACLQKWIDTSNTCPQCRQKTTLRSIIKLFFEHDDGGETQLDPSKIQNALDEARVEIGRERKAATTFRKETERLSDLVETLNKRLKELKKQVKEEQTIRDAMRSQLAMFSQESDDAKKAKQEAKRLREKLQLLERFEMVMTGNIEATQDMLRESGDWSKATREVATYCIALKKEFESSKASRKNLQEEIYNLKRDNNSKTKMLLETKRDREQQCKLVQSLRDDLQALHQSMQLKTERMETLEKALSNAGCSKTSVLLQTPKLSRPMEGDTDIDLNDSRPLIPMLSLSSDIIEPSPNTRNKHACKEFDIPFVKITSKVQQQQKENKRIEDQAAVAVVKNSSLFQSRRTLHEQSSKIRNGFDGLGGHQSFVQSSSLKRPSLLRSSLTAKRAKKSYKGIPALPSLDSFLS